jgi:hypothetical protein
MLGFNVKRRKETKILARQSGKTTPKTMAKNKIKKHHKYSKALQIS